MSVRTLRIRAEQWAIRGEFRIARGAKTHADVVVVEVSQDGVIGRGEATPYARFGETMDSVTAQLEAARPLIESQSLQDFDSTQPLILSGMKAGAARNALDCALWDLDCKQRNVTASWNRSLPEPKPVVTAFTLSVATPKAMAKAAQSCPDRPLLKLKLTGDGEDIARLDAVRAARPDAELILDANESLDLKGLKKLDAAAQKAGGVALIEQPLPADADAALADFTAATPLCADESLRTSADLDAVAGRYQAVNIKLDKAGGFDEAARLAIAARDRGLTVMIGCMVATSLAMAPAFMLTPLARYVDLDGPLLLETDRAPSVRYEGALMHPPPKELWG